MKNKVIYTGGTLTVVTEQKEVFSCQGADIELYKQVNDAQTIEEIKALMIPELYAKEVAKEEKKEAVRQEIVKIQGYISKFGLLVDTGDFEERDNSVYMVGVDRSIPPLLIGKFLELVETYQTDDDTSAEYNALKNFWRWTCLNPRAEVADMLYDFLAKNFMRINSQGFFYALRNVVKIEGIDDTLVKFVSENYTRIKMQKKGPGNFLVLQNRDETNMVKATDAESEEWADWKMIGNLKDLYNDLPNMESNRYTDAHTRTFDIRVGKVVNMPMEDCNWSTADCAHAGLHFTMDSINQVGCGDTTIVILINPMKVVGIGSEKGRCYEYLPLCVVPQGESTSFIREASFDTLEMESQYGEEEMNNLETKVKENFSKEAKKYSFNIPKMPEEEVVAIAVSLEDMKGQVATRVKPIADKLKPTTSNVEEPVMGDFGAEENEEDKYDYEGDEDDQYFSND